MHHLKRYQVEVERVIDGDTFIGTVDYEVLGLEFTLKDQRFRLKGIDAYEKRGKEKELGLQAKEYLEKLIANKYVVVSVDGKDKYGRWLVEVFVDGINVNIAIVQAGFTKGAEKK